MSCEIESILPILATLAAAFFGAWFAFLLDGRTKRKAEEDERVRNGNLALYNLYDYWNALQQYHKEVIAPFKAREDAWLNMPPTTERYDRTASLLALNLSFILGTPDSSVYADVYLEEHRFHSAAALIKDRNAILLTQVRPALSKAGAKINQAYDLEFVEATIGTHLVAILKIMTPSIIENVEEDIASFQETYAKLRKVLTTLYPKRSFIKLKFELGD